jgi:hypothetical protein
MRGSCAESKSPAAIPNAFLETHPKIGYTVIILSNYDPPSAVKAGQWIGALLRRLKD